MDMTSLSFSRSAAIGDDERRERAVRAQVAHARKGGQAVAARGARAKRPQRRLQRCRRHATRCCSAGSERSISSATRETSPIRTIARRRRVLEVVEAALERAVEGPDQRRRQRRRRARDRGSSHAPRLARARGSWRVPSIAPILRPTICSAISAAGFGPWSPAPWTRPLARSQLRSASTAIAFVHGPSSRGRRGSAATYHLYGSQRAARAAPCASGRLAAPPARTGAPAASSERPSLGKLGVPVLPASQSMSRQRRVEHLLARGARGAGAVAVRQAAQDRPRRRRAPAGSRIGAARASAPQPRRTRRRRCRPTPRSACDRDAAAARSPAPFAGRGERRHHAGDAEHAGARVALAPAFGDDVDDRAAAGTSPSRRRCRRRPSAPAAQRAQDAGVERAPAASGASPRRACRATGSLSSRP